jgi:hypothetical protein
MKKYLGCALLLLAAGIRADPATLRIDISSRLQDKLKSVYGSAEAAVLRRDVADQLSRPLARGCGSKGRLLTVEVMIEDAQPSHPTRKQVSAAPSVDSLASHFLGGARLSSRLRGADGSIHARIVEEYYPATLAIASASGSTWADAQVAIGRFASKVAVACHGDFTPSAHQP